MSAITDQQLTFLYRVAAGLRVSGTLVVADTGVWLSRVIDELREYRRQDEQFEKVINALAQSAEYVAQIDRTPNDGTLPQREKARQDDE